MRTIQLSEDRARTLAAFIAPQWATRALKLAAKDVPVNNPFRHLGETTKEIARGVQHVKRDTLAMAELLRELGATIPAIDRAKIVVPYKSPSRPRLKLTLISPTKFGEEHARLVKEILDQI